METLAKTCYCKLLLPFDEYKAKKAIPPFAKLLRFSSSLLLQLLYNSELNQLVSGSSDCLLKVWDVETGRALHSMGPDIHGPGIELTAACLDPSGYRLVTGAEDTSVRVWDVGSGQELKTFCSAALGQRGNDRRRDRERCASVIGLGYCDRQIIVVVLSHRIILLSVITCFANSINNIHCVRKKVTP